MQAISILKSAAVVLATLGTVFPQTRILANEQTLPPQMKVKVLAPNTVLDIKLGKDGALTGRTINHAGTAIVGATVIVRQGKNEVSRSVTDSRGNFAISHLKSGLYEVSSGTTVGSYRVWSEKIAPPSAKAHCLLVMGENGARGQYGLSDTIAEENLGLILLVSTTGLALAGLLVAIHAENIAKSAENTANRSP